MELSERYRGKVMGLNMESELGEPISIHFNEWVYGGLIYDKVDKNYCIVVMDPTDFDKPVIFLPTQESISESTFVKDINGVTIFEKDVLKRLNHKGIMEHYIVVDDHGVLGVTHLDMYVKGLTDYNTNNINRPLGAEILTTSTIVGNIIDEPEWLKSYE